MSEFKSPPVYKNYEALIRINAGVVTVEELYWNAIGNITWQRDAQGKQSAHCVGAFPANKTTVIPFGLQGLTAIPIYSILMGVGTLVGYMTFSGFDNDNLYFDTFDLLGSNIDTNVLLFIEIRVYP